MKNKLTESQIQEYCGHFKKTGKLPVKQIPCTVSGKLVTIFGDNLKRRTENYGSLENLLRTFVSREGSKIMSPKEIVKAYKAAEKKQEALRKAYGKIVVKKLKELISTFEAEGFVCLSWHSRLSADLRYMDSYYPDSYLQDLGGHKQVPISFCINPSSRNNKKNLPKLLKLIKSLGGFQQSEKKCPNRNIWNFKV